jgi:ABC-2 type transport system ATP-binding protein
MSVVSIKNLVKKYKNAETIAVDNINLSINKGEIYGLLGPNGAGKTTTLSILCGLVNATSGEVNLMDLNVSTKLNEIKKSIGVVPQDIALYPALTARENLEYFGALYGIEKKELTKRINTWLENFSLTAKADKKIETYSGGMKRRANLIAGILHQPDILILDEPTVGIDVHSRNVILDHLKELNNNGTTIIYTSHHLEEAQHLCNRIAIIDCGKIIIEGSPKELLIEHTDCRHLEDIFLKLTGKAIRD